MQYLFGLCLLLRYWGLDPGPLHGATLPGLLEFVIWTQGLTTLLSGLDELRLAILLLWHPRMLGFQGRTTTLVLFL